MVADWFQMMLNICITAAGTTLILIGAVVLMAWAWRMVIDFVIIRVGGTTKVLNYIANRREYEEWKAEKRKRTITTV